MQVEHPKVTTKELFDGMRGCIDEGLNPAQAALRLGIPPGQAFRMWNKVQAQIAIDEYGISSKEARAQFVRSALDRLAIENSASEDPKKQMVALQALRLMMQDPKTGINDRADEPDWDKIKTIGSADAKVEDVITVPATKPA